MTQVINQVPTKPSTAGRYAGRYAGRSEWKVQAVAISVAVACFVAAGQLVTPIDSARMEHQLVIDPDTVKGLPPGIALLGKLGTFRALAIDWASIRAERLKEEGKTYEALQLHETVCALAPRFPKVWAHAAWNMAYNISVAKYTPEARWQWVQNGIKILRDRGIPINPKAVTLYKELAWIYWHKIGDFLDDEHLNYKRALAVEMERILGPPPVTLTDDEYFDWFRGIVDAPRDLDELLDTDEDVARLVFRLRTVELAPDVSILDFVARNMRPELQVSQLLKGGPDVDPLTARRMELLTDSENKAPLDRLLAALRSKVLREENKFDLERMLKLMVEEYGPLDWRNAFSHSLYWSAVGDELSRGHENLDKNDQLNNARFIFFSLQNLILKGKMTLWPDFDDPYSSYLELTPDLRYIPYLFDVYLRLGKEHFGDDPRFVEGTAGPIYMNGLVTAMQNWVELLYLEGGEANRQLGENFYAWLRDNNPHPDGSTQERYLVTLDEFVMGDILDRLETYKAASGFIRSLVQRGLKQFALGLTRPGNTSLRRARQAYNYWMVDTAGDINERRMMQAFPILVRDEIESYMKRPDIAPLYKVSLWKPLPLYPRQLTYDHLLPYFQRLCETRVPPWDVTVAFDEPPGMDEFRKSQPEYRGAPRRGVDEGQRRRR